MADSVDQQNTSGAIGVGFGDTGNGRDYMVQGFIPTLDNITAISFWPNSKDGNANIGYKVWIDTADASSNPLHGVGGIGGATEITNAGITTGSLNKYTLASPVILIPGNRYVICFAPWNTSTHAWAASYNDFTSSTANPYANGRRVHLDGSFANPTAPDSGNNDIQFQTWGLPAATLEQEGYRFRADDGNEAGASYLAAQDTDITQRGKNTNTRLRTILNGANYPGPKQFQIEYRKQGSSQWHKIGP